MKLSCEYLNVGGRYTCKVKSVSIMEPGTVITEIVGDHLHGFNADDVDTIYFKKTAIHYFPRGLHRFFPRLKQLQISNCGLKTICRDDLIGLEALEGIVLDGNKLTTVPSDLLIGMDKLESLSFVRNEIEFLSSDLFKPVMTNNWKYIDFWRNESINCSYSVLYGFNLDLCEPANKGLFISEMKNSMTEWEWINCWLNESDTNWFLPDDEDDDVKSLGELMKIIDLKCKKPISEASPIDALDSPDPAETETWKSSSLTDFVLIAEKKRFEVHKFILAAHSELLAKKFEDDDELYGMKLEDTSSKSVEAFLHYVYSGKISADADIAQLLKISTNLQVQALKIICEKLILKNLPSLNAISILQLGNDLKCESIKTAAFAKLRNSFPDIELPDELMNQPEELKELIVMGQQCDSWKKYFQTM